MENNDPAHLLLGWFDKNRRDLPWRKEPRDPYRVWVSEIMLQQTQVRTVIDYFNRWIDRFPDVFALAGAPLDRVLKAWEGLGYYSRARNLHKAARLIVTDYDGSLPRTAKGLQGLPGIGPYTAAAIASLCFDEQVMAVDGNVRRVTARLFAIEGDVTQGVARRFLKPFYQSDQAGRVNEALMELGALCCQPSQPLCPNCPVRHVCQAWKEGTVDQYPSASKRKRIPHVRRTGYLILQNHAIFLRKRSPKEMLGGLWGIPLGEETPSVIHVQEGCALPEVTHTYTHFRITVRPVLISSEQLMNESILKNGRFVPLKEIPSLALSTLDYKILERLKSLVAPDQGPGAPKLTETSNSRSA